MILRRHLSLLLIGVFSTILLLIAFQRVSWGQLPQVIGLGDAYGPTEEQIKSGLNILPDLRIDEEPDRTVFKEPKIDSMSPYPIGDTKPPGSNYTRRLVIAKTRVEDTTWIEDILRDMIADGSLWPTIYVADNKRAEHHPPQNKGHEVMIYLSYIIDFYEDLPDVSIFMHAHQYAWHNNDILDHDAAQMIRFLSPERVTREGYMNLRCHWDPGCPDWLHPGATLRDPDKLEEVQIAAQWTQLFPEDAVPTVLAQPCCAQFALSKERILALPKSRYLELRDWVLQTPLDDYISGRVFEYAWQYIFTASSVHCPSMSACYCDGYGLCFGSPEAFDMWFEIRYNLNEFKEELRLWEEKAAAIELWREIAKSKDGKFEEEAPLEIPEFGKDKWLREQVEALETELYGLRDEAFERGKDPQQRASESGRTWKVGDGF